MTRPGWAMRELEAVAAEVADLPDYVRRAADAMLTTRADGSSSALNVAADSGGGGGLGE